MIEDTAETPLTPVPAPTRLIPRRRPDGRELLATAKGILIAARRCSDAQAFDELLDVSRRHHLTVVGAARHLVDLAAGPSSPRRAPGAVRFDEWEQLLAQLPPHPHAYAYAYAS
ncbi:ANTAR domain-containing protein [Rhodococcus koreensis]|uniref:ANTAR domain-containing protein n=1 Tax=Rhodococcus koreensis TaxID=99653 RepID=UPI0036DD131D